MDDEFEEQLKKFFGEHKPSKHQAAIFIHSLMMLSTAPWEKLPGGVAEIPVKVPAMFLYKLTKDLGEDFFEKWMEHAVRDTFESHASAIIRMFFGEDMKGFRDTLRGALTDMAEQFGFDPNAVTKIWDEAEKENCGKCPTKETCGGKEEDDEEWVFE
jgi:hypothetical protein